jgi:LAO/AO transport system kinase
MSAGELSLDAYAEGIERGDRTILARAITLVESDLPAHRALAHELLARIMPRTGNAHRVGITGVPGAGKSTFIDALGMFLIGRGEKVAVLAVDPTSDRSGGSILGDKTRMARLSREEAAFIRPSPNRGALGGVARATREAMLLCEAAGHSIAIVETVGVGQSETAVAQMVDSFLVLLLPNAGDELQGIKRGILELADIVAINKADGDQEAAAKLARQQYEIALHYLRPAYPEWTPEVHCVSARQERGIAELWERITVRRRALDASGSLRALRADQAAAWMWQEVQGELSARLRARGDVAALGASLEREVRDGKTPATLAAARIVDAFLSGSSRS